MKISIAKRRCAPWRSVGRSAFLVLSLLSASHATAQGVASSYVGDELFAGGELESYLRLLQLRGSVPAHPWSVRAFSIPEAARLAPTDSLHPWAGRYRFADGEGARVRLIEPRLGTIYNSAFPYGGNDGPLWAGRGLTTSLQGGFSARYGPVSLVVAPTFTRSENASFEIVPNQRTGDAAFGDARLPDFIDLPQRFGTGAVTRLDPGESTLRVDLAGVAAGLSTATQYWGPATEHPIVLGNNAPGFAHAFLGTSRPVNLWLGRAHGRLVWGRLEESAYVATPADSSVRFMAGLVAVFTPRGVPGLELGAGRFFHQPWTPAGIGLEEVLKPFETFSKNLLSTEEGELESSVVANQITSVFGRWVFPRAHLEVYGEFGTEDHRHNLRDLTLEPDHDVGYTLGLRKLWPRGDGSYLVLRGELLNASRSHLHRARRQEPFYIHASLRQGHTNRGQLLGSPAGYGGAASSLGVDYYHPGGRWSATWRRTVRGEDGSFLETGTPSDPDVIQALGGEGVLFRGRWDVTAGVDAAYDFNRDLLGSNVFNLRAVVGLRARIGR